MALINRHKRVRLRKEEAASIALHFINAENYAKKQLDSMTEILEDISAIIEDSFEIELDRTDFSYSRFISHMRYLFQRKKIDQGILSDNREMYVTMQKEYPKTYGCVLQIRDYIRRELDWETSEEELLYLMIHVNRLCTRKDAENRS